MRNFWCMRFEVVNKTVKTAVHGGNMVGIARIAMEKQIRSAGIAAARVAMDDPARLVSSRAADEETIQLIAESLGCRLKGMYNCLLHFCSLLFMYVLF